MQQIGRINVENINEKNIKKNISMYFTIFYVKIRLEYFLVSTQYGHSQSEKKLGLGEKYHRSIKVHT